MNPIKTATSALFALLLSAAPGMAGNVEGLLARYESVRAMLAKDDASGLPTVARKIGSAAERELGQRKPRAGNELEMIRDAARALERANGTLAESRAAFASLSRGVVALLAAEPELASGRFVYACPMVKGYGRWVQVRKEIENPYKGAAMLRCAVPVDARR